ncbi:ATP-binding protein [Agromyces archimandritae]|uniref:ATP-binding protein n=1 Tax=Agromyces archimandritae TaxID=2781962 RepID=A0A975FJQ0_9MICO|nr:ATP-binding protein [Agromyces archimandritae]QTX03783.1 ATP-binding protein [Agromyces archimandritae]
MAALLDRHATPIGHELLEFFPGLIIEGARQVGKSTIARRLARPDARILNLDDRQTRAAAEADPSGFVAQAEGAQLVIDEIQRVPELTLAVKSAIDADRRAARFIITGSSSLLRVKGTADSLAGRVARLPLYGLSRGEAAGTRDDFATALGDRLDELPTFTSIDSRAGYTEILAAGAYPEIRDARPSIRAAWIDAYLQGIIGRDMVELRREVQPGRAMAVLRTLAGRQSAELVKSRLAEETAVPPRTITGYLDLLHDVGLIASIPPWTPNISKREIGRSKTFVIDSAVAMWLARLTPAQLTRIEYGEAFGAMLEGFVAAELLRQRTWSQRRFDLFHYRERNTDEVDIILEFDDGAVIALEVKASTSFSSRHFTGLARLRERLGDRFQAGIVLNSGSQGYRYADRLFGAPISAIWQFNAG